MARFVQYYEPQTPSEGLEGALAWSSGPFGKVGERDSPAFNDIETGIAASGTSSQANSYGLTKAVNVVGTAAANSGVRLPTGTAGDLVFIANRGVATMNIYPATDGTINGGSADAAITVGANKAAILFCAAVNTWVSLPGA